MLRNKTHLFYMELVQVQLTMLMTHLICKIFLTFIALSLIQILNSVPPFIFSLGFTKLIPLLARYDSFENEFQDHPVSRICFRSVTKHIFINNTTESEKVREFHAQVMNDSYFLSVTQSWLECSRYFGTQDILTAC